MVEYSVIAVTYTDYIELLSKIHTYGLEGWEFGVALKKRNNFPKFKETTIDFLCNRRHQIDIIDNEEAIKHKLN